jgi:hypothetical protein
MRRNKQLGGGGADKKHTRIGDGARQEERRGTIGAGRVAIVETDSTAGQEG